MARALSAFGTCVALTLGLAIPASARAGTSVAIIELAFDGSTPPAVRGEVEQQLRGGLTRAGCGLLSPDVVKERLKGVAVAMGCRAGPCLVPLGRALQVERLVVGGVSVLGSSYDMLLTALDAQSGVALAQVSSRCDVCTFAEVGRRMALAAAELVQQERRVVASQGRLVVEEPGKGSAEVWIDGVPLGSTPQARLVPRGWHRVAVRVGGRVFRRHVWVQAGAELRVRAELEAPRRVLRLPQIVPGEVGWPAWVTLGSAVGLLVAGSALLALDRRCERENCQTRWNTDGLGLALLGAGAAATVATGLLIHYYRRQGARAVWVVAPSGAVWVVAPRSDGVALLLSRRF